MTAQGSWTDRSGTVATGGTSQVLAAANANRSRLMVQNPSTAVESLFINYGAAASTTNGKSIEIKAGILYDTGLGPQSQEAVNITAATGAHAFMCKEM